MFVFFKYKSYRGEREKIVRCQALYRSTQAKKKAAKVSKDVIRLQAVCRMLVTMRNVLRLACLIRVFRFAVASGADCVVECLLPNEMLVESLPFRFTRKSWRDLERKKEREWKLPRKRDNG